MSPKVTIQVYQCPEYRCRNVEEYAEETPKWRRCSKCGKQMKHIGTREINRDQR
jgi:hypothetical protein